jgi:hypothetical protein
MRKVAYFEGLVVLATTLVVSVASGQTLPSFQFQFTEKSGPYSVGLKVIEQYDRSRVFHDTSDATGKPVTTDGFRPLQTLVWYPADESKAQRMTIGNYAALIRTETSFDKPVEHGKP